MTQLEMALAAQENPFEGLLWLPVGDSRYFEEDCYCEDDDDWGESDADWLRSQGAVDADGNLVIDDLDSPWFEVDWLE